MGQPYVGEIRMFGGTFAPSGWAFCNGAILPISENEVLFQLIGTTYGGNGSTNFALPNLQSRLPVHQGQGPGLSNQIIGQSAGTETVTLTLSQIPSHNHTFNISTTSAAASSPQNNVLANGTANLYLRDTTTNNMNANAIGIAGGSQPHDNIMPFLCITFIISLFGVFPSQS
jgi:microcystin-dependent protein